MQVDSFNHGPKTVAISDLLFVRRVIVPNELPAGTNALGKVQTKFDFVYTTQNAEELCDLANAERAKPLSVLYTVIDWPYYFAGELASGPLQLLPSEIVDGVRSAFQIGKFGVRVRNTPQEVFDVIKAAGGQTREILPPAHGEALSEIDRDFEWEPLPGGK